jgi:hypothetical protein
VVGRASLQYKWAATIACLIQKLYLVAKISVSWKRRPIHRTEHRERRIHGEEMARLEICVALNQRCGDRCAEERGRDIEMHLTDVGSANGRGHRGTKWVRCGEEKYKDVIDTGSIWGRN